MCEVKRSASLFAFLTIGLAIVGAGVHAVSGVAAEPVPRAPSWPYVRPSEDSEARPATIRTENFRVEAANERIAQVVGDAAERERKARALAWLGKELPAWGERCTIRVTVTSRGNGGFTNVNFGDGKVGSREVDVKGNLEDILTCVLPHEITHTIFADYFGEPMPRWADEGAAVLSEDKSIKQKYHADLASLLKAQRALPLRRLMAVTTYPDDPMALYTEGYALTEFLVNRKDRKTFLQFLKDGKHHGWEDALKDTYGYKSVDQLEDAWLAEMKR